MIDDSEQVINYYKNSNRISPELFNTLKMVMLEWRKVITSLHINDQQKLIFKKALAHSNAVIWFELGSRLAKYSAQDQSAIIILTETLIESNYRSRFNSTSLIPYLKDTHQKDFLSKSINDKNKRVRIKAADTILTLNRKDYLTLIEERLSIENNEEVKSALIFCLVNFNKIIKRADGGIELVL
jgi:hypothetical protein